MIELTDDQIYRIARSIWTNVDWTSCNLPIKLKEALADVNAGEWERLQQFGYCKGKMHRYNSDRTEIIPQQYFDGLLKQINE